MANFSCLWAKCHEHCRPAFAIVRVFGCVRLLSMPQPNNNNDNNNYYYYY